MQFLMIGGPLMVLALYGLWHQINGGESTMIWLTLGLSIISGGIVAFWFRERLYFKKTLIFRFVWGQLTGMIAYRDIERAELTGEGLRVVMKNGTHWQMPGMGEPQQASEIISCLRRAGVQLPSNAALRNKFGLDM